MQILYLDNRNFQMLWHWKLVPVAAGLSLVASKGQISSKLRIYFMGYSVCSGLFKLTQEVKAALLIRNVC